MAVNTFSDGGVTGSHNDTATQQVRVSSATSDQQNRIRTSLIPVACFRVDNVRFEFDSSFVLPDAANEMKQLAKLRQKHKLQTAPAPGGDPVIIFPPLSIFGHADPVGNDDYNKQLSGRRATAVYGLLTRDVALWEELYSTPLGNDHWGLKAVQTMLAAVGFPPGGFDGKMGPDTSDAVKAFQSGNGLAPDGQPGPGTRKVLFAAYMDQLCGKDFRLDKKEDFLAGTDALGKGDYQGCSEFNPVLIFSQEKADAFAKDSDHTDRNDQNVPNRRVIGLLFRPGSRVLASKWPCPRVKEGVAECRKRFWSDGEDRRGRRLAQDDRTLAQTHDTFACRFYDRISNSSPCEEPLRLVPLTIRLVDDLDRPLGEVKYHLEVADQQIEGTTVGGVLRELIPDSVRTGKLVLTEKTFHRVNSRNVESPTAESWSIDLVIGPLDPPDKVPGAKARLQNLAFFVENSLDASVDAPMRRAVQRMQTFYDLKSKDGNLDAATVDKLKEKYGS